jgi:hypothetical protein
MDSGERLKQLEDEENLIARGVDSRKLDAREIVALMRVLRAKLETAIERRSVASLMEFLYANLGSASEQVADLPIACRMGCSHCCHTWVDARPPEVFFAVNSMGDETREAALASVRRLCELTGGKTYSDRLAMVTPCPLLTNNLCSIYAARPINCRTNASADVSVCEGAYLRLTGDNIPTPFVWPALRQGYGAALEGAIINAGLAPKASEWNEALRLVLTTPGLEARWLSGEDVFSRLPRAHERSFFDRPAFREMYEVAFSASA